MEEFKDKLFSKFLALLVLLGIVVSHSLQNFFSQVERKYMSEDHMAEIGLEDLNSQTGV